MTAQATTTSQHRLTFVGVPWSEWTKFSSLRSSWITLAVTVLVIVVPGLLVAATRDPANSGEIYDPLGSATVMVALAALIVAAMGALLSAGEYSTGMIRSTLTAIPTRLPMLLAKILVPAGAAFLTTIVCVLINLVVGDLLTDPDLVRSDAGAATILRVLICSGLYLAAVTMIGVSLGILIRSSAGAISIFAGFLLILPQLLPALPQAVEETVKPYHLGAAGLSVISEQPPEGHLAPGPAGAVLAVYVVVLVGSAALRLAKTDA
ncbi:ABC transporter permease [Dactylosporangium sp. NPDC000555]|uniref:ABC transporter permease n=1 Tax=Dactylosporangium sp. NPDC000555 TaxID=3154260 RepID=UPI00331ABE3E